MAKFFCLRLRDSEYTQPRTNFFANLAVLTHYMRPQPPDLLLQCAAISPDLGNGLNLVAVLDPDGCIIW